MFKKIVMLLIVFTLLLTACAGKNTDAKKNSDAGSANSGGTGSSDKSNSGNNDSGSAATSDIGSALTLVLGGSDSPSVFPSYHLELRLDSPKANDDYTAVVNQKISISADVAGKNVHIFQIDPGETAAKEGYIIGDTDKEYKLVDGTYQEMMGQIALGWAMWPLQVVVPYAFASSLYKDRSGTEDLNGRTAIVYVLDTSKADPATLASMAAMGIGQLDAHGTVWIDKETGGMLKLILDYTNNITTLDNSTILGPGSGHIELEISKVDEVTVTSPK